MVKLFKLILCLNKPHTNIWYKIHLKTLLKETFALSNEDFEVI